MTTLEVGSALQELKLLPNVWLHEKKPWFTIGTVCLQSTYHIYLQEDYDYKFNNVTEMLEIAILDPARTIVKVVDYSNIVCFNGTYYYQQGVPIMKEFR